MGSDDESSVHTEGFTENQLMQMRTTTKSSLTKIKNFVSNFDINSNNIAGIIIRNKKVDALWKKYDKIQTALENMNYERHQTDRDKEEKIFEDIQTDMQELITESERRQKPEQPTTYRPQANESDSAESQPRLQLEQLSSIIASAMSQNNLPSLNLKPFDGQYKEYKSFIELFDSIIHANRQIPDIQKLYHLKSLLKGEAAKLIENLSITASNYSVARTLLAKRYNNEQFILNSHMKTLFEFAPIQKESVQELRKLVSNTKQEMEAITNLGIDTSTWDQMIIYLVKQKVDTTTRKQWELSQKNPKEFSKLADFYNFLEQRCFALEAAELSLQPKAVTTTRAHAASERKPSDTCKICKGGTHKIFQCETFLAKSIPDRIGLVKSKGYCFNCLRTGHSVKDCEASKCRKCGRPHNSLIHQEQVRSQGQPSQDALNTRSDAAHQSSSSTVHQQTTLAHCSSNIAQVLLPTALPTASHSTQYTRRI